VHEDTMDKWDDAKLRSVVLSKAGNPRTTTDVGTITVYDIYLLLTLYDRYRLFVNTSSKRLSLGDMAGFGNVQMVCIYKASFLCWLLMSLLFQGDNCQYRHALPPGFVLKSEKKAKEEAEKANTISIEEFLETEVCASPTATLRIFIDYLFLSAA
jgi:zinc finger CCCH domain-containing protein 15